MFEKYKNKELTNKENLRKKTHKQND